MLRRLVITGLFGLLSSSAFAACFQDGDSNITSTCVPATKYEVQIRKVELCTSAACSNPVVVAETVSTFDIASVSAGAAVGAYADLDDVAAGIYTHVRTTLSPTISFSTDADSSLPGNCASGTSDNSTTYNTTTVTVAELSANSDFGISWNSDGNFEHLYPLTNSIAISKAGALPQIQVDFATQDAGLCLSGYGAANLFPGIPEIDIRIFEN